MKAVLSAAAGFVLIATVVGLIFLRGGNQEETTMAAEPDAVRGNTPVVWIHDRHHSYKATDYVFFENTCFIRAVEFAEEPGGKRTACRYFLVQNIDRRRLEVLTEKFLHQWNPPPYKPVPWGIFCMYNADGEETNVRSHDEPNIYLPMIQEVEDFVSDKKETNAIPDFFYRPANRKLLEFIQNIPESNYPGC